MQRERPVRQPRFVRRAVAGLLGVALACGVLWTSLAPAAPRYGVALAPGDTAPLLRGLDLRTGESTALVWSAADLTLVNFWATWCVPCQQEMPELNELWTEHRDEGLVVVGVNHQETPIVEIESFVHTFGAQYPILVARKKLSEQWGGISALPTSFLIDPQGKILRRYVGATPEQIAGLVADVENVLAGRPMGPLVIPEVSTAVTAEDAPREVDPADTPPPADREP